MRIRSSKRGLTFSFAEREHFTVGEHYRYVLDLSSNELIIVPDVNGKYIFSKKGSNSRPLVDLRNKEIKDFISLASYIEIEILCDSIIIHVINKKINTDNLSDVELVDLLDEQDKVTFEIPKSELIKNNDALQDMLRVSGLFSQKVQKEINYVYDVASLFSGAGLLDYPFHKDESFDIKFALDFDKSACETYKANIGEHILHMDIRNLEPEQIPDVEVMISGNCCQGFSNSNRAGNVLQDINKRLLIDDVIRCITQKHPLIFVIENVPQFLTKENGIYLDRVLNGLSDYNITYSIICDSSVGGYSTRKRMILIGSHKSMHKVIIPNIELSKTKACGEALSKVNDAWFNYYDITKPNKETEKKMNLVRPGHNYTDIPEMAHLSRHSNTYRRLDENKPSITLVNWRKVNIMPPKGNRILSVSEAAAIMGLEQEYRFYGTLNDKQQQVGNGVTQAIANFVKNIVKNALYEYTNTLLFG